MKPTYTRTPGDFERRPMIREVGVPNRTSYELHLPVGWAALSSHCVSYPSPRKGGKPGIPLLHL
jgi:hypothetical protein